jgi:hypothetical protein
MSIAATLLFGSLARADHAARSDTDLLMINLDDETRHVSVGHLSLFIYPWRRLEEDARSGNLFTCHLVKEAKPLVDPDDYFSRLQRTFQFRPSYQDDIERASDLGWYLVRFGDELNSGLLAKRALWCVRTILIARSAERRAPVFAPKQLAELTPSQSARALLNGRHKKQDNENIQKALRAFLVMETTSSWSPTEGDKKQFLARFVATSNSVAFQTLKQEADSQTGYV